MAAMHLPMIDHTVQLTREWVRELADRLDWPDEHRAFRLLRVTLQTVRDWLDVNEAERIENGTSATWNNSRGSFGSAVAASSEVSGSRSERGSRASDTHNVGGNVLVEGSAGKSTREVTNDDLILRQGNSRSSGNFDQRAFGGSLTGSANGTVGTPGKDLAGSGVSAGLGTSIYGRREWGDDARTSSERSATKQVTRGTDKSEDVSSRVVVSGNSGGQPSTTQPIAGPCDSPNEVTQNNLPSVLPDMVETPEKLH
mgnify:CR=1 FL=1